MNVRRLGENRIEREKREREIVLTWQQFSDEGAESPYFEDERDAK